MSLYEGLRTKSQSWIRDIRRIWGTDWCASRVCAITTDSLFAVVVDAVTEQSREGLLNEILYADDLALMSESLEELRERFQGWRSALEGKGLKVESKM